MVILPSVSILWIIELYFEPSLCCSYDFIIHIGKRRNLIPPNLLLVLVEVQVVCLVLDNADFLGLLLPIKSESGAFP